MTKSRPTSMTEWGSRYIAQLKTHGFSQQEATAYWVKSIVWPHGKDLIALTIDMPEDAADYDAPYLKEEKVVENTNV